MGLHKNKAEIARLIAFLLERDKPYSVQEIDRLVRNTILPDRMDDPHYAPDHIRLAMIENCFLMRDAAGTVYRVHPDFQLPAENEQMYQALIEQAGQKRPFDTMLCPACRAPFKASTVSGHFLRRHRLAGVWEELMEKYAR